MAISIEQLEKYSGQLLQLDRFRDYSPNGLQVEGRPLIKRLACGVTASQALIEAALDWQADAIVVHHGYFWKSEDPRVVGGKKRRLAALLKADVNLLAYHLPLDAHPELGNNACLGQKLGLIAEGRFGEQELGWFGRPERPLTLSAFAERVERELGRRPLVIGDPARLIERAGWCSGGAQGYFGAAIQAGCDVYLTGEASEHNFHSAQEEGVAFVAAGHHASERYGVQALAAHLAAQFGLEWRYFELENPV